MYGEKFPALSDKYRNEIMLCIMPLDSKTYLDGKRHGGLARHSNHSRDSNYYVEIWLVRGSAWLGKVTKKHQARGRINIRL